MNGPASILVVEDDYAARTTLCAILGEHHFVEGVGSVADARRRLEQREFQVVVTDHDLPDGRGAQFLRMLEESSPGVVGVIVTGFPDEPEVRAVRASSGLVLGKPYDPDVLLSYVRNAAQFARLRVARARLKGALGGR
jgi:DNA-binding NtrC family response regulator